MTFGPSYFFFSCNYLFKIVHPPLKLFWELYSPFYIWYVTRVSLHIMQFVCFCWRVMIIGFSYVSSNKSIASLVWFFYPLRTSLYVESNWLFLPIVLPLARIFFVISSTNFILLQLCFLQFGHKSSNVFLSFFVNRTMEMR